MDSSGRRSLPPCCPASSQDPQREFFPACTLLCLSTHSWRERSEKLGPEQNWSPPNTQSIQQAHSWAATRAAFGRDRYNKVSKEKKKRFIKQQQNQKTSP